MDDFERRWKLIQEQLRVQASGEPPRPVSSGRTLFGIRSTIEEKMDRFAREIEDEYRTKRESERGGASNHAGTLGRMGAVGRTNASDRSDTHGSTGASDRAGAPSDRERAPKPSEPPHATH